MHYLSVLSPVSRALRSGTFFWVACLGWTSFAIPTLEAADQPMSTATALELSPAAAVIDFGSQTATSASQPSVTLTWEASTSSVVGYRVYRATVSGGPYTDLVSGTISALTYTDTAVASGSTYYYVTTSVNQSGIESVYSNQVTATIPTGSPSSPPPPPTSPGPTNAVTGMTLNGSAALDGTRLRLTNTGNGLAGSGWFSNPVSLQTFSTDFTFQLTNPSKSATGNGIAFVIQNAGTNALGPSGGGLGYGPDNPTHPSASSNTPIGKSVAVKFDLVNNAGEGTNSTGLYRDGASPTVPAVTLGGGVNLHTNDIFDVHMTYDGTNLTMTMTDTATTTDTFTTSWKVDIPGTVGATTGYVGFTGGTGSSVADQDILSWSYTPSSTAPKTPNVYRSVNLPAVSSGPTFRTFTDSGFPDGAGTILDAIASGDNVTFTVNVATAGTYDVKLSFKEYPTRGISQLSIDGANVGAPLDQYLNTAAYGVVDFGTYTFAQAGNHSFKFTVLGKDWNSSGYSVTFDDFTLTPE